MKRSLVLFAVLCVSALNLAVLPLTHRGPPRRASSRSSAWTQPAAPAFTSWTSPPAKSGKSSSPIAPETDLAWNPAGDTLAFVTQDGGYGLLRSLRGCFDATATCADTLEVLTAVRHASRSNGRRTAN